MQPRNEKPAKKGEIEEGEKARGTYACSKVLASSTNQPNQLRCPASKSDITALHTPPLTLACTASVIQSSARGDRYRCCCLFLYYLYIFACLRVHCIALLHALRKETPQASWSAVSGGAVALVWSAWLMSS
jgi:hypothetical protein